MTFEEIICLNSVAKEGKLLGPSKKCVDKPDNGITVTNPAAYHVIKDCAIIANKYIPLYVFGTYANPFKQLAGKFTAAIIKDFVARAKNDIHTSQLMRCIIDRGRHNLNIQDTEPVRYKVDEDNPYGDYDSDEKTNNKSNNKNTDEAEILKKLFNV